MSRLRYNRQQAVNHLRQRCPVLARFIRHQGPLQLTIDRETDLFIALARSIIYQQLSGKAAATIYQRFEHLFKPGIPTAAAVLALPLEQQRTAGLSRNKALAIHDLATRMLDGSLASARRIASMSDEQVIKDLCQVRGIGPWTAQMLLLFTLGRPDVMPSTDLGIQKGVQRIYRIAELPSPAEVLQRTLHLAPFRSAASWYFWRVADTPKQHPEPDPE